MGCIVRTRRQDVVGAGSQPEYDLAPFFNFANLIVDPKDENKIYKPDGSLIASNEWRRQVSATFPAARTVTFTTSGLILTTTDHLITGDDGASGTRMTAAIAGGKQ